MSFYILISSVPTVFVLVEFENNCTVLFGVCAIFFIKWSIAAGAATFFTRVTSNGFKYNSEEIKKIVAVYFTN